MKKILLLAALSISLLGATSATAQVRVNINVGAPVARQSWYSYDDDYYYMPDQDCYYNVRRQVYVYLEGGGWVYAPALPQRYGGYNYNTVRSYRVRARAPFDRNDYYRRQYATAYNGDYRHDNGNHNGWNTQGGNYNGHRNGGWNDQHNNGGRRR